MQPHNQSNQKTALITGITGQDGAYLAAFLLQKNYRVIGLQQISATPNTQNIMHLMDRIELIRTDLIDPQHIVKSLAETRPDEIYNLAGQSHVGLSFDIPEYTMQVNGLLPVRIMEAMRILGLKETRFYQASTSEIFGNAEGSPQNETTPLRPVSPYAAAKAYAHHMVEIYRAAYGLHAGCGILFNHESPIRGEDFVTRKITKAVAAIKKGEQDMLYLGNLEARRDWGHAKDYIRGMWLMLQQAQPDDYVLATGENYSVRDFVQKAFACADIPLTWEGEGVDEVAFHTETEDILVQVDPALYRPSEVHALIGDASKARSILGWSPQISFDDLVKEMVEADLKIKNL